MALSESEISRAKDEAREFLEYSIFTLATLMAVDLDELSGSFEIPVPEGHHEYVFYESLKKQVQILEGLDNA